MRINPIAAVMIHVASPKAALAWYKRAFPTSVSGWVEGHDVDYLELDGVRIEFVRADGKVSSGSAGTVVYWTVPDFSAALTRLQELGAPLYRGPMNIEEGLRMCQFQDPWGNCLGLRGK